MNEQDWHEAARLKLVGLLGKDYDRVECSHGEHSNLGLFRGRVISVNHLSDADIIALSPRNRIRRIIEIESSINPKKVIGIIVATHLCTTCHRVEPKIQRGYERYRLREREIVLEIRYRRLERGSNTSLKLKRLKKPLKEMIKTSKGCLVDFIWRPISAG